VIIGFIVAASLLVTQAGEGEGEGDPEGEGEGEVGAGEGEGEGEGEDPCASRCEDDDDGNAGVAFCDNGVPAFIVCRDVDVGAVCGLVSAGFGFDCLLPDGVPCDPGYAAGASRCRSGACRDEICAPGAPVSENPKEPTRGTAIAATVGASSSSCAGCPSASLLLPLAGAAVLRRRPKPQGRAAGNPG